MPPGSGYPIEDFLEAITAQLDQTQDALRLKAVNRPLTFALKDFNIDLKVFVEMDAQGRVTFRPAGPNESGASTVSIAFTTITRPMIEENTISMAMTQAPGLDELGLAREEQARLAKIGVRNAAQLRNLQRSAGEDTLSRQTGVDLGKIRDALHMARPRLDDVVADAPDAPSGAPSDAPWGRDRSRGGGRREERPGQRPDPRLDPRREPAPEPRRDTAPAPHLDPRLEPRPGIVPRPTSPAQQPAPVPAPAPAPRPAAQPAPHLDPRLAQRPTIPAPTAGPGRAATGPSADPGDLVGRLRERLIPRTDGAAQPETWDDPAPAWPPQPAAPVWTPPEPEPGPSRRRLTIDPAARSIRIAGRNLLDEGRAPAARLDGRPLSLLDASSLAASFSLPPGQGGGRLTIELPDGSEEEFDLVERPDPWSEPPR